MTLHQFTANLVDTLILFWPVFLAFAAILAAICITFIKLCAQDWAHGRSSSHPPKKQGVYNQDNEPAWTPSSPECRLEYRKFNRQRRQARRSAA